MAPSDQGRPPVIPDTSGLPLITTHVHGALVVNGLVEPDQVGGASVSIGAGSSPR